MQIPPQVSLKDVSHSEAIEAKILEKIAKLEKVYDRIMGCRIAVEAPQRRHHQGKLYSIRIDLTVPGGEVVVNREENEDIYVAIRDAFDAAKRKLLEYERRIRGVVKLHGEAPLGRVTKLYPEEGYGFIETSDGREIYFHRNSVLDPDFDRLKVGAGVVFMEEQGKKGPQATRVTIYKRELPG